MLDQPGSELKRVIEGMGFVACNSCLKLQEEMNSLGVEKCILEMKRLSESLHKNAVAQRVYIPSAAVYLFLRGFLFKFKARLDKSREEHLQTFEL